MLAADDSLPLLPGDDEVDERLERVDGVLTLGVVDIDDGDIVELYI